jgi:hypothetical protein
MLFIDFTTLKKIPLFKLQEKVIKSLNITKKE